METSRLDEIAGQRAQWENALASVPDRYGTDPSDPGRAALAAFAEAGAHEILELGGGQGRDTLLFARAGLRVTTTDFAKPAIATIREKAEAHGLREWIEAVELDVREPLPFADASFDGCFSHMLFNMALTGRELVTLAAEVRRVLRPPGLCVYTARTTDDVDCGRGTHLGENLYALDGFGVHFFDEALMGRLAAGYELLAVEPFEEGALPRRLVRVTMRRADPLPEC